MEGNVNFRIGYLELKVIHTRTGITAKLILRHHGDSPLPKVIAHWEMGKVNRLTFEGDKPFEHCDGEDLWTLAKLGQVIVDNISSNKVKGG